MFLILCYLKKILLMLIYNMPVENICKHLPLFCANAPVNSSSYYNENSYLSYLSVIVRDV